MKPLVSVVIAVYNGEKYLDEAIESVLAQSYPFIELVIVNDGSIDGTESVIKKYAPHVCYFHQVNQGQPAAMNLGIRRAKGSYISFLDADDFYMPDKVALQVEYLELKSEIDFVFGYVEQFFSPELEQALQEKWICPSEIAPGYLAAAGLFRKECFERVGLFNDKQRIGVFIEWYMRSTEIGLQNGLMAHKVLCRRIHQNNMGIQAQQSRLEYVQIVKEALKRRLLVGV